MNDDWKDLLASWQVSDPDPELKGKVLDIYRKQFPKRSVRKNLIRTRIAVPLPIAAATASLVLVLTYFAMRPHDSSFRHEAQMASEIRHPAEMRPNAGTAPSSMAAIKPSEATEESRQSDLPKTARKQTKRDERKISTIILQGEQETIQCIVGTEYRPIAVPKIYSGFIFDGSK